MPQSMKISFKVALSGLLLLSLIACSESKLLMKGLSHYPQPLGYAFDSPIDSSAKTDSVIVYFNGFQLDSLTTVQRKKGLVLPFIFINITDFKYRMKLGANQLRGDFNDFFFNALLDESERSGSYALCYDSVHSKNVYEMEVSLDTCLTDTYLSESSVTVFYVYGYFSTYSESSFPTNSKVACSLRLRKGDQILKDTTISVSTELGFMGGNNLSRNERMMHTAEGMVTNLCESTRECISKMVREVNTSLVAQKR